jgi:ERCC4-related helicase
VIQWTLPSWLSLDRAGHAADGERQVRTAREILKRFASQPGVVLADEVGMGKTYVALAVAVAALADDSSAGPVVVIAPPSVADKWVREWRKFVDSYLVDRPVIRGPERAVRDGLEFLRILDDDATERQQLVVLTHGAMSELVKQDRDEHRYVMLAVIQQALAGRPGAGDLRELVADRSPRLQLLPSVDPELVRRLLKVRPASWRKVLIDAGELAPDDDDPVPKSLVDALAVPGLNLAPVREAVEVLPRKHGDTFEKRLREATSQLRSAVRGAVRDAYGHLQLEAPLLILDEAHHLRNRKNLFKLFVSEPTSAEGEGPLFQMFSRMLFLTATPFNLRHDELKNVLECFNATSGSDETCAVDVTALSNRLDGCRRDSQRLEASWRRLRQEHLAELSDDWWDPAVPIEGIGDPVRAVRSDVEAVLDSFEGAKKLLAPWVIRHRRESSRVRLPGDLILRHDRDGDPLSPIAGDLSPPVGLEVQQSEVLPFLLANRADAVVSKSSQHRDQLRLVAVGLSSSYDVVWSTDAQDLDQDDELDDDVPEPSPVSDWYLQRLRKALPNADASARRHPKVEATAERAFQLWSQGEKVVVFCFYRSTGRALRRAISAKVEQLLEDRAAAGGTTLAEQERVSSDRLRKGSAAFGVVEDFVEKLLDQSSLEGRERDRFLNLVVSLLRTPIFRLRYLDFGVGDEAQMYSAALGADDVSATSLAGRLRALRQSLDDLPSIDSREPLFEAVERVQTGSSRIAGDELGGASGARKPKRLYLANVRLANGEVAQPVRERLLQAFNTPFFPDVLIASKVLAEGVDLHQQCRHVIHHDLDWNPAVLEQRTGRLDRIGSLASREGQPVVIYEPFIAGAQDERQYRVVVDRERWFEVIMGSVDAGPWSGSTEPMSVPLPERLAEMLRFDLQVSKGEQHSSSGSME